MQNQEYILTEHDLIVSKTDLKGIITFVNDDLVRITGYSRAELIGTEQFQNTAIKKRFIAVVSQLLRDLYAYVALEELNPDVVEPILSNLNAYLEDRELVKIRLALDNFDFDEAVKHTDFLILKYLI